VEARTVLFLWHAGGEPLVGCRRDPLLVVVGKRDLRPKQNGAFQKRGAVGLMLGGGTEGRRRGWGKHVRVIARGAEFQDHVQAHAPALASPARDRLKQPKSVKTGQKLSKVPTHVCQSQGGSASCRTAPPHLCC
jgi:hypothetical protein